LKFFVFFHSRGPYVCRCVFRITGAGFGSKGSGFRVQEKK
jgi:hypothetical protein